MLQVIYSVGISGFAYILDIIIADTSSLKNRSLAFAVGSAPYLFTTFIGPIIASSFTDNGLWRWAFAASSLCLVFLSLPLFYILILNMRKAKKLGLLQPSTKAEPWTLAKIHRYLVDFDGKVPSDLVSKDGTDMRSYRNVTSQRWDGVDIGPVLPTEQIPY